MTKAEEPNLAEKLVETKSALISAETEIANLKTKRNAGTDQVSIIKLKLRDALDEVIPNNFVNGQSQLEWVKQQILQRMGWTSFSS